MIGQTSQKCADLAQKAEAGDMRAGRELIRLCRRGMLVPYWEKPRRLTEEIVVKHLARREKVIKTA